MQTNLSTTNSGAAAAADNGAPLGNAAATSNMFTQLLVAQIKNQDPLEPTDPSQFVNQLTQLSQTESLQALATQATTNAGLLQSLQALALGAQVGSRVSVTTDHVSLDGSTAVNGDFTLQSASSKTVLVLTSASSQQYAFDLGAQPAGPVAFTIDPAKLGLPAGTYSIAVSTDTQETPSIEVDSTLSGVRVSSTGGVVLDVAGVGQTDLGSITAYNGPVAANSH
jgi:flagellar basal-body rod modification protein FlgD